MRREGGSTHEDATQMSRSSESCGRWNRGSQSSRYAASATSRKRRFTVGETNTAGWIGRNCAGLKELEGENKRSKKIVARRAMDMNALRDLLGKEC